MAAQGILRTVLCKVGFDATESEKQIKEFNKQLKQTERQYKKMEKAGAEMTKIFTISFAGLVTGLALLANSQLDAAESTESLSSNMQAYSQAVAGMNEKLSVLKESFLEACIPLLTSLVNIFSEFLIPILQRVVNWWDSLSSGTKSFISVVLVLLALVGPAMTIVSKVGLAFNMLKGFLHATGIAGLFANASLAPLLITLLAIAAVLAIILGFNFSSIFDTVNSSIPTATSGITTNTTSNNTTTNQTNNFNISSNNPNYDAALAAEIINRQLGGQMA